MSLRGALGRVASSIVLVTGGALLSASCADLAPLEQGVCGNAVVDPDEDCDGHALGEGTRCAPAGEEHACRFVCADAACPTGWGCGADGICRVGSGAFARTGDIVSLAAPHEVRAADFDGDGATELLVLSEADALGRSSARIVRPGSGSEPATLTVIPRHMASPSIGDLDADHAADILFADTSGTSVLLGRRDRRIELAAFPYTTVAEGTSLRVIPMDVDPAREGDELVHFVDRGPEGTTLRRPATAGAPEAELTALPAGEAALAGPPVPARLDEGAPCSSIVIPFQGAGEVLIFSPCRVKGEAVEWNEGGQTRAIELPPGVTLDGHVLVVDLDQDGHVDLLIGTAVGAHAAWGLGDGTFLSDPAGGEIDAAAPYTLPIGVGSMLPLAAGDINDDGVIDFVLPWGVMLSTTAGLTIAAANFGTHWTEAAIADLNADGRLDVIAASSTLVDISVFTNVGDGVLNPASLATDGHPSSLLVGDFDGDLINDVVFAQKLERGGLPVDQVMVAFGQAHGTPLDPALMGELGAIEQLTGGRLVNNLGVDGIRDVVVVSQAGGHDADAMYVFPGNGSRVLDATLRFGSETGGVVPAALAIGRFHGTADIAAVGVDLATKVLRLWHIETHGAVARSYSEPLSSSFHAAPDAGGPTFRYGAHAVAADLRGEGRDALVVVAPYGLDPGGAAILVAELHQAGGTFVPGAETPFAAAITVDSELGKADLDGDGRHEVLLTTRAGEASELLVFWSDGSGGLDVAAPTRVALAGGVTGSACLPSTTRPGCDLVVVSPQGAHLAIIAADRSVTTIPIASLPGAYSVAALDFDRDGALDLALATDEGVELWRAVPERE